MLREWTDRLPPAQAAEIWHRQACREVDRRIDHVSEEIAPAFGEPDRALVATFESIGAFIRMRRRLFPNLPSDPAFDLLLTLASTPPNSEKASVTGLAYGADVPLATAIRYLAALEVDGVIKRSPHPHDGRKTLIELTEEGRRRMATIGESWLGRTLMLLLAPALIATYLFS